TISLLAMLVLWFACYWETRVTRGFIVDIAASSETCGDNNRQIITVAIGNHKARSNTILSAATEVAIPELSQPLRKVMSYRAEKVAYVKADSDVSWGEFME